MGSSIMDCEDVFYSHWAFYCKDSMDLYTCQKMERSYFCSDCDECFTSFYLENCMGLSSSYMCFDCRNSSNLLGCVGLRQEKNRILNEPAGEEEIASTLKRLNTEPDFRNTFQEKYRALRLQVPVRDFWEKNCENVSGNYIVNSNNAQHAYNVRDVED